MRKICTAAIIVLFWQKLLPVISSHIHKTYILQAFSQAVKIKCNIVKIEIIILPAIQKPQQWKQVMSIPVFLHNSPEIWHCNTYLPTPWAYHPLPFFQDFVNLIPSEVFQQMAGIYLLN